MRSTIGSSRANISKKGYNRLFFVVLTLIVFIPGRARAIDIPEDWKALHPGLSLENNSSRGEHFSDDILMGRAWLDARIEVLENIHFHLYPVWKYDFENDNTQMIYRKNYTSINLEDIYIGIGKQPIIWGVGRGRNPTNYFTNLQLLDKQKEPELALEGVNSYLIEYSPGGATLEAVLAKDSAHSAAIQISGYRFNTDLALSFFKNDAVSKTGVNFETNVKDMLVLYGETAVEARKEWEGLVGIDRTLTAFNKSNVSLEYYYDHRLQTQKEISLSIVLSPREEISMISSVSHDIQQDVSLVFAGLSYHWKNFTFVVQPVYKIKHGEKDLASFPPDRMITVKVISYPF